MSITDLHLCKDSVKSNASVGDSQCECPPEYYCAEVCGEDYSVRPYISWQHFPRSTSSRSRCDDSSEVPPQSLTDTPPPVPTPEKEPTVKISTTQYPITKSFAQLNAQHYLEVRHIFKLLNFMISHLVCNEPDDPVQFLEDLLGRCLKFRDAFGEPPLLFTTAHIKSLYTAFDPFERGSLTMEQYNEGMTSLGLKTGITKYNEYPPVNDEGYVEDRYFFFEAGRCLLEDLKQMLRIPLFCEENRLWWKMKLIRLEEEEELLKQSKMKLLEETQVKNELKKRSDEFCKCFGPKLNTKLICKCPQPASLKEEPEQLFYNNKMSRK